MPRTWMTMTETDETLERLNKILATNSELLDEKDVKIQILTDYVEKLIRHIELTNELAEREEPAGWVT